VLSVNELFEKAARRKGVTLAVACPDDSHVLLAVTEAARLGICDFTLVGDRVKTAEAARESGTDISGFKFIDVKEKAEACLAAARLVSDGEAGGLMKGLVDTSIILKAVLSKELDLRTDRRLSHFSVFFIQNYHKPLIITDAAINLAPDYDTFCDIISNSVAAAKRLGIECPKVALLAAKEKVDPKMPVTMIYRDIINNRRDFSETARIAGPLALDNAVSKESAVTKGIINEVAGDADILVCPNLEAGNILYKSLSFLNSSESGGMVLGSKSPIVLTSRADSAKSKLISIALAVCNSRD
jgi:phosphate butyryltransferase